MTAEELKVLLQNEDGDYYDNQKVLNAMNGKITEDELKYLSNLFKIEELSREAALLCCGDTSKERSKPRVKTEEPYDYDDDALSDCIGTFLNERFEKVYSMSIDHIFGWDNDNLSFLNAKENE